MGRRLEMKPIDRSQLAALGWIHLHGGNCIDEAAIAARTLELAHSLGSLVRGRSKDVIERLVPKSVENASPASLSSQFGYDAFPFHMDTAHWLVPARYIVLSCARPGKAVVPTLLVDTHSIRLSSAERSLAKSSVFFVKNGRNSFYSSILDDSREFIRFDPGCMLPETAASVRALQFFSFERLSADAKEINWAPGDIVVIDNWRTLHGRAAVQENSINRLLLRCLVS